jgi:hypothetical protein
MKPARYLSWTIAAVLVPGAALAAPQTGQAGEPGFKLYSARAAGGYDTAIVTEDGRVEDGVFIFVPAAIAYQNPTGRGNLQFIYEPEFEIFQTYSELNAWNQAAGLSYSLQATRDLGISAGGTFLYTHDRSRQTSGLALSRRGLYVEGRGYFSVSYRLGRDTSLSVGANSWLTRTQVEPQASLSTEVDEWRNTFSVGLTQTFATSHQLLLSYTRLEASILNTDDLPDENLGDRSGQDAVSAGYQLSVARSGLRLGGTAGVIRLPREAGGDDYTYSFSASIDKTWSTFDVGGGYQRTLSGLFRLDPGNPADGIRDPLLNQGISESANFLVSGEIGRRLTINQQLSYSRTEVSALTEPIEALVWSASAGIVITERTVPFVNVMYWDQTASEDDLAFSRVRITAGLRFYWDAPAPGRPHYGFESIRSILPIRTMEQ